MDINSTATKYEFLLFDMDDTLYPESLGLSSACTRNIQDYMRNYLQIEESQVPKMCLDLYKEFGLTLAGLKALGFEFDPDEFHAQVHGKLPYERLKPDPVLRNLLLSMPQRKIIFTNADKVHAAQVLSRMGLKDCFEGVICFETLNPTLVADKVLPLTDPTDIWFFSGSMLQNDLESKLHVLCKPSLKAMEAAIRIANIDPKKTLYFDDNPENIGVGKEAGLNTVIVGSPELVPGADFALNSIHNIKEAIPEIWEFEDDQLEIVHPSTAVETTVLA